MASSKDSLERRQDAEKHLNAVGIKMTRFSSVDPQSKRMTTDWRSRRKLTADRQSSSIPIDCCVR